MSVLAQRQLGVGVKGGAEALAHAARLYLSSMEQDSVFVKLDFVNAFNSIRRDSVLEAVAEHAPNILAFTFSAYGSPSFLHFGDFTLQSAEGVQQGDPLGPLLFCLALSKPLSLLNSDFVSGYLDDIGIGSTISKAIAELKIFEAGTKAIGLQLNYAKCEVIGISSSSRSEWDAAGFSFLNCESEKATLLGSPIHLAGVESAVNEKVQSLKVAVPRLARLSGHEALFLLSHSLAIPKLQYLLRTAPCFTTKATERFDELVIDTISSCLNISLNSSERTQVSLPVRWGGLGLRSASDLAPSCFLSSLAASSGLLHILLPLQILVSSAEDKELAFDRWKALGGPVPPPSPGDGSQKLWDDSICESRFNSLLADASDTGKARLLAGRAEGSGSWLHAIPSSALGLRLNNDEVRIAAGLRIGARLVREHKCVCGLPVAPDGLHGLSCRRSAGRHLRHRLANDVIARAFRSADVPVEVEPSGLLRTDGKRPDGVTAIPWSRGKCLVWDFTCPDTLAPSHITQTSAAAGSAARTAEVKKRTKYADLSPSYDFFPFAVETFGSWGSEAWALSSELGKRLALRTGESRSTAFFRQRLDVAIQRGNAAAVRGSFPSADPQTNINLS
jgi:hypothetical protein